MPVSRIAIVTSGRPRSIFQAPAALKPETCGSPVVWPCCVSP
jgi:hypothetical protein